MNFILPEDHKSILKFAPGTSDKVTSRESSWVEFKESFNWNSRSKYAKTIAAFANNKGGFIIFGVSNSPRRLIGMKSKNFEELDEARIAEYLNNVFSPKIEFQKFIIRRRRKKIEIIYIDASQTGPIISTKNDGDIKESEIYYRYNARSEKIKYGELNSLLNDIRERERKSWTDLIERISTIGPSNAAILDTVKGNIKGTGGTLIIDEKLLPKLKFIQEGRFREKGRPTLKLIGEVAPASFSDQKKSGETINLKITDNPSAPEVRVSEENILKTYSLNYRDLVKKLRKRYIDFKLNPQFHKIKMKLKEDIRLCKTRFLDPNNPGTSKKDFYHPRILKEFDKYYKKIKK